jgi:hypothetical protein
MAADTGRDFQPTETDVCDVDFGANLYTATYPEAKYQAGKIYCLAWPMKNHGAATCTNEFIPDTELEIFRSGINPTQDPPTQTEFKKNVVQDFFGKHASGKIDCLGFQRSPKFCDDTGNAMGTGCFRAPSTPGKYVFQWLWEFNAGKPYSSCWDAEVVSGAGTGIGGLDVTTAPPVSNMNGDANLCKTAWAALPGSTGPDPSAVPPSPQPSSPSPSGGANPNPSLPAPSPSKNAGDGGKSTGADGGDNNGGSGDEPKTPLTTEEKLAAAEKQNTILLVICVGLGVACAFIALIAVMQRRNPASNGEGLSNQYSKRQYELAVKKPDAERGEAMDEWHEQVDPETGEKYYYNPKTRETTWDIGAPPPPRGANGGPTRALPNLRV